MKYYVKLKKYFIFNQSFILFQNDKKIYEFEKLQYFSFLMKNQLSERLIKIAKYFKLGQSFRYCKFELH